MAAITSITTEATTIIVGGAIADTGSASTDRGIAKSLGTYRRFVSTTRGKKAVTEAAHYRVCIRR
jgi:hypothetical protein